MIYKQHLGVCEILTFRYSIFRLITPVTPYQKQNKTKKPWKTEPMLKIGNDHVLYIENQSQ